MRGSFLNWTKPCVIAVFLAVLCISGCKNSSNVIDELPTLKIEGGVVVSCNQDAEYIEIPNGVTKIGDNAFHNCNRLKSVSIPNTVTSIGEYAFANCHSLTSIAIPNSVTSISDSAFNGCGILTINYDGTKAQWEALGVSLPTGVSVYCSDGDPNLNPEQKTCTLFLYPNAPEDTPEAKTLEPKMITVNMGSMYTLPQEPVFSVEGYYFLGWTESLEYTYHIYKPGEEIYIPDELNIPGTYTLYAVWGDTTYTNGLVIYKNIVVGYVRDELPADVVIPDGVTAIGVRAFFDAWEFTGCDIIKSVTIPESVNIIDEYAFWLCPNLEKVIIKGQPSEIGTCTFEGCASLKSIELPDSVKSIGIYAFSECTSLESVIMNGVKTIDSYAFQFCKNIDYVSMNSVEHIEHQAFAYSGLKRVTLPNTLKFIGDSAFSNCDFESITIPDSVSAENIEMDAFYECKKLKKAVLPDHWNKINDCLFRYCTSLEDVKFPSALKIINGSAFMGCSSLKEVIIPDGVTEIQGGAFSYCKKLSKVKIPDSVKIIGGGAFIYSPLSEIIIPDNVTIGNHPFSLSTNLRTISLPASIINDGVEFYDIFYSFPPTYNDCPELEIPKLNDYDKDCSNIDIILRDGATRIPKEFFGSRSYKYKSIKIPSGVKIIEEEAFLNTYFDNDIELPDSVTVIMEAALYASRFAGKLPNKLEYIGAYAFAGYVGESVTIPGSVKFFDEFAFKSSDLKSVTIEHGITEIPAGTFSVSFSIYPGVLEKIEIPNTVTKIGPSAFFYQPNLKDVKIPDSVKYISWNAFVGCENLNAQVTGEWYRVYIYDETKVVDSVTPTGNNLYLYSDWTWYRK